MLVLALDCCLAACQVGIISGADALCEISEPIGAERQERLPQLTAEALAAAGLVFDQLGAIAVTIGPGSFTGLRVGLAFAKGLALSTGLKLTGVGTLAALANAPIDPSVRVAAVDAGRGRVYWQAFAGHRALNAPQCALASDAVASAAGMAPQLLVGSGAEMLAAAAPSALMAPISAPPLRAIAEIAERNRDAPATPLYLRLEEEKRPW
ncbi:MAG TPA: tRNA (adenosine(37)-N6)-threonylcarbamoyltransferase complex dimerization subunit type 1 TsaB [Caulobacteraceae bacterium]|nr:tRNA (adenosine(37)-N6)-threonylcarbamoyltransferase complex dimerization subunit type 1 TsaB [Caulobacteraceae bacterium]